MPKVPAERPREGELHPESRIPVEEGEAKLPEAGVNETVALQPEVIPRPELPSVQGISKSATEAPTLAEEGEKIAKERAIKLVLGESDEVHFTPKEASAAEAALFEALKNRGQETK